MERRAVSTPHAPAALGPYSQAIVVGGLVFCSGTAGIDPVTGEIPEGIEAQTRPPSRPGEPANDPRRFTGVAGCDVEHAYVRESLGPYLLGGLPPVERAMVERHLAGCPECSAEVDGLTGAVLALSVLTREESRELVDRYGIP